MEIAVAVGAAVAILAVVVAAVVTARLSPRGAAGESREPLGFTVDEEGTAVVVLDVGDVDPASPAIRRLVDDAATRAFAARSDLVRVVVRSAPGTTLGTRVRKEPGQVEIPSDLYEPRAPRRHGPDVRQGMTAGHEQWPRVRAGEQPAAVPARPLAERFELSPGVRSQLTDPGDAVELVRAILEAAGHSPEVRGDVLRVGDMAVVVMRAPIGEPLGVADLSQAFHRFRDSGASRGVVVTPGFLDPVEVRRRELLAPELGHAGPDGIQRMADAAAVGADPLRLAAGGPLRVR